MTPRGTGGVSRVATLPTVTGDERPPELLEWEQNTLPTLPQELQDAYNTGGIDGFNEAVVKYNEKVASGAYFDEYRADVKAFEGTHAEPGGGDVWITQSDYDNLPSSLKQIYDNQGYDALLEAIEATKHEVETPAGETVSEALSDKYSTSMSEYADEYQLPGAGDIWITKEDYESLSPQLQKIYDEGGYDALAKEMQKEQSMAIAFSDESRDIYGRVQMDDSLPNWESYISDTEGMDSREIAEALISTGAPPAVIYDFISHHRSANTGAVVSDWMSEFIEVLNSISEMSDEEQFNELMRLGFIPEGSTFIPAITEEQIQQMQAESVGAPVEQIEQLSRLQPSGWSYTTPEQKKAAQEAARLRYETVVKPYLTGVRLARERQQVLEDREQATALSELVDYINDDDTLRWFEAAQAGIPLETIRAAGYDVSQSDYRLAQAGLTTESFGTDPLVDYLVEPSSVSTDRLPKYDIVRYLEEHNNNPELLRQLGFSEEDIDAAQERVYLNSIGDIQAAWYEAETALQKACDKIDQDNPDLSPRERAKLYAETPENERLMEISAIATAGATGAIIGASPARMLGYMTPVLGTYLTYEDAMADGRMSAGDWAWVGASALLDIITLGSLTATVGAAARSARGATAVTRASGGLRAAGSWGLAEISAPFTAVAHPIQTIKETAKGFARMTDVVHPTRIPTAATEISYTTVRVPVKQTERSAETAMEMRDLVTTAAIEGRDARATVEGITLSLEPTALNRVGAPIGVHATPDVRPWMGGLVIREGREGGLFISPNLHTRFTAASAFGDAPEGGIRGALLIRDENVLRTMVPSSKVYKGTVEIETVLAPGTVIPAPSQILTTRDASGEVLRLLVIGEPFTPSEIAALKILGSADTIRQVFKSTYKLTDADRDTIRLVDELGDLGRERGRLIDLIDTLRAEGKTEQLIEAEADLARIEEEIGRIFTRAERIFNARGAIPLSRVGLSFAQYTPVSMMEMYANSQRPTSSRREGNTLETRLPTIRVSNLSDVPKLRASVASGRVPTTIKTVRNNVVVEPLPDRIKPVAPRVPSELPRVPRAPRTPTEQPRVPRAPRATIEQPRVPRPPQVRRRHPRVPEVPEPPSKGMIHISGSGERSKKIPDGSIAWRQGAFWKYIPAVDFKSGKKPRTLPRGVVPIGAKFTELRTPSETIQVIGDARAPIPDSLSVDLGVTDIVITNRAGKISYSGKGLTTDVGERVPGVATGMSITAKGLASSNGEDEPDSEWLEPLESNNGSQNKGSTPTHKAKKKKKKHRNSESLDAQIARMRY